MITSRFGRLHLNADVLFLPKWFLLRFEKQALKESETPREESDGVVGPCEYL